MSEISKYEAQKKKLDGLCEEHDFTYRFRKEVYPITLTISPLQGMAEQMSMLEEADGSEYISPNASMTWIFADGEVTAKVEGGTFTMSKTLESKFVNIFKKMVSFWQQYFFRYLLENNIISKHRNMPIIDEADADDDEDEDLEEQEETPDNVTEFPDTSGEDAQDDDLFVAAKQLVKAENKATIALLQRRLNIGYAAASRLMDRLESEGVVGPYRGNQPREVLAADIPQEG